VGAPRKLLTCDEGTFGWVDFGAKGLKGVALDSVFGFDVAVLAYVYMCIYTYTIMFR
jgi:hypothetical protein